MHYAELRQVREELTGPGGQFEIIEADVLGQQLRCFKHAPPSVREVWLASALFAERPYLIYEDEVLTSFSEGRSIILSFLFFKVTSILPLIKLVSVFFSPG